MTPERNATREQFGALIYDLREDSYLTQAQLAEQLGVSQSEVSRWEHGLMLPNHLALGRLETFAPGCFQELHFLWLRERWLKFHEKPRPKRPENPAPGGAGT